MQHSIQEGNYGPCNVTLAKDGIECFLRGFHGVMTGKTADAPEVQSAIRNHPAFKHKGGKNERSNWELAFIDQIVLESLSEYLKEYLNKNTNLNGKSSCDVILAESSQAKDRRIAKGTAAWSLGHPFNKAMGANPDDIYERWKGNDPRKRKSVFPAVCPDIALLTPFRVVFECKYFNKQANRTAGSELVHDLYQAFFYRAMPTKSAGTAGLKYGWDYEYACFLAYDETPNGRLKKAWNDLSESTRKRFWEDSNIFVMMLPE